MDNSPSLPEGWMPVFDPDSAKPWSEKLYTRNIPFAGKPSTSSACEMNFARQSFRISIVRRCPQ